MRKSIIVAILVLAPGAAMAADLSGTWQISGPVQPVCTISQSGNQLSGHCKGPAAEGALIGTSDGQTAQFTFQRGQLAPVMFSGTVSGDGIAGTATMGQRNAPFTARRQGGPPQAVATPAPASTSSSGPPAGVWKIAADGSAVHQVTGMVCPAASGPLNRNNVTMFDRVGFDVACNYKTDGVDLTLYVTMRDPSRLQQSFDASKQVLVAATPGAVPRAGTLAAPAGLQWLQAAYDVQGGAQRSDILYAQLYGWEYEIRATYAPENAGMVTAAIADLTAAVRDAAGGHLAACRGTQPLGGTGVRNRDLDALLGLVTISAVSVSAAVKAPLAESQWCPDIGFGIGGGDYVWWHSIAAAGDGPVIRITNIRGGNSVLVVRVPPALAKGAEEKLGGKPDPASDDLYALAVQEADSTKIAGIFNGRPSFKDVTELVLGKAFGVYAEIRKDAAGTGNAITLYKPF